MQTYRETRAETRKVDAVANELRRGLRNAGVRLRKRPRSAAFERGAAAKLGQQ